MLLLLLRPARSPAVATMRHLLRRWVLRLLVSLRRRLLSVCCILLISGSIWLMCIFLLLLPHMRPRMLRALARLGCPLQGTLLLLEMMIRVCRSPPAFRCRLLRQTCILHAVHMLLLWLLHLCTSHVRVMHLWLVASVHPRVLLAVLLMICACPSFVQILARSLLRHVVLLGPLVQTVCTLLVPAFPHVRRLLPAGGHPL